MTPWTSVPAHMNDPPGVRPRRFRLSGTVPAEFAAFQKARRTGEYGPRLDLLSETSESARPQLTHVIKELAS